MEVSGLKNLKERLKALPVKHASGVERGLMLAALRLQQESQSVVPVKTGNLRSSYRTTKTGSGFDTVVEGGYYGVNYAVKVHEDLEMKHAPGKQAKFLEEPARRLRGELVQIVLDNAKRKQ